METRGEAGGGQLGPCAMAFLASGCVMSVEMAASRFLAMHVGAGLYTWTSIIGVVLGGITLGNALGGRLADRFPARQALGALFLASALSCAALPLVNYWVARWVAWDLPSDRPFPFRVALHVTFVFLLPSTLLGLIGPVVAKLALERSIATGRTVGRVYAWGALGSILGTFASGYILVEALGSSGLALAVAAALLVTGIALTPRLAGRLALLTWPLVVGACAGSLLVADRGPGRWVWTGKGRGVQERRQYERLYSLESEYSFIRVFERAAQDANSPPTRTLFMDNLVHSVYSPENPGELLYEYEKIYAVLTHRFGKDRERLRTFFIGGGGYIFPRHVREQWPAGFVEVAEIDPGVTEANVAAFGLRPEDIVIHGAGGRSEPRAAPAAGGSPPMHIHHLDARNRIDDLLRQKRSGEAFEPFDFVYGDAFNDYCVPAHLVTRELFEKVKEILRPETGIYLMNVIDIFKDGRFLAAIHSTLGKVFGENVYIFSNTPGGPSKSAIARDTYIVVGSMRPLDLAELGSREGEPKFEGGVLSPEQVKHLERQADGMTLTDDYAPVENLLEIVVQRRMTRPR